MARTPRTPRTTATSTATTTTTANETATTPTATTATTTTTTTESTMATVPATTTTEPTTEPTATTPATTTTAMVPATPATPATYAAGILRALLAGDELAVDPESVALAISALESPMVATTARATTTTARVLREPTEQRAAAVAAGLPTRKIWRTKAYGPLLVGACNAAGGAVVRDTRESYPASDVWAGQKVSDALAFVVATYPEFTRANATAEALGRIGADGVAR